MKILEAGHVYSLAQLDTEKVETGDLAEVILRFVNREGKPHPGTTTQEVLRALIDRTYHCDNCLPSDYNEKIVYHLRQALLQHELRALERKLDKGEIMPEMLTVSNDGHFSIHEAYPPENAAKRRF